MDNELKNRVLQIMNENPTLYMPIANELTRSSVREYFFALKKNIDRFLERDEELVVKLKTIKKAVEDRLFKRKIKKALDQKTEEIETIRNQIHEQIIPWWEEFDEKCPINVKIALTPVGETVCFGFYKSFKDGFNELVGKIQWRVLSKAKGRAFLVSERILDIVPYSSLSLEFWQNSILRKWCQDLYEKSFTDAEKMFILPVILRTPETENGVEDWEKVFIPSATDVQKYMPNYRDRYTQATEVASGKISRVWDYWCEHVPPNRRISGWWTRTSNPKSKEATCVIDRITTSNVERVYRVTANESRKLYDKALKSWPMGVRPAVIVSVAE